MASSGAGERGDGPCEDSEFSGDVEAVEVIGWVGFLVSLVSGQGEYL